MRNLLIGILAVLLVIAGYSFSSGIKTYEVKDINPKVIYLETTPKVFKHKGSVYVIYKSEEGPIILLNLNNPKEKMSVSEDKKHHFYSNFNYVLDEKNDVLYVIYWAKKIPLKYVKVAKVDLKNFKVLSQATVSKEEPLGVPQGVLYKGKLFVFWYDERKDPEIKRMYKIYGRSSKDGVKWNKEIDYKFSILSGSVKPVIFKKSLFVFGIGCKEKICGIYASKYNPQKDNFEPEILVIPFSKDKKRLINYDAYYVGAGENYLFVGTYDFGGEEVFSCKSEDGKKFDCQNINVAELIKSKYKNILDKEEGVELTFMYADFEGDNIFYTITAIRDKSAVVGNFRFPPKKNPFILYSKDAGKTWRIERLTNFVPFANTQYMPHVDASPNGVVAVSWIDYRNILPQPYISISKDFGKTWVKDIPLYPPYKLQSDIPDIKVIGDNVYVWYVLDKNLASQEESYLEIKAVPVKDANSVKAKYKDKYTTEQKRKLLKKTLDAYVKALSSGKEDEMYNFFDPYFRAYNPKEIWKATRVKVKFLKAELLDYAYLGGTNLAQARFKVKFKQPEVVLGKFKVPEESRVQERVMKFYWVFIDGNWHQVVPKLDGFFLEW